MSCPDLQRELDKLTLANDQLFAHGERMFQQREKLRDVLQRVVARYVPDYFDSADGLHHEVRACLGELR